MLDFTTTIAGPHCTRLLADLGAEVIKIEAPEGDMMRTRPPLRNGASTSFGQLNAGKKSVVLDLKAPPGGRGGRAGWSRPPTSSSRISGPGSCAASASTTRRCAPIKPELIYCAISGYGQTGPSAELPAYAPVIHAASGYDLAQIAYQGETRRPDYCGIYIADVLTGTYAFGAIMTALYQRQATGAGQMIDVSMLESMLTPDLERDPVGAVPGGRRPAADLRPGRDQGRLHQPVGRQRAHVSEPGRRVRPSRHGSTDPRFAEYHQPAAPIGAS